MKATTRFWQSAALLFAIGLVFLAVSGYLAPTISAAAKPLVAAQQWLSSRYLAIFEFLTVPTDVATLRQKNLELENTISSQQTQIVQLQQQLREAQVLYALLDFARARPQAEYVAAAVIGRDPSPFLHYIFIDHGTDDGLRRGMPVVTQQGLVGQIDAVTASAARVKLITDPASVINVRLQTLDTEVVLRGSLTGDINLDMIPQDVPLKPGELVLTSGLGGGYPADVVIGQVATVRKRETDIFQSASVQPSVDFSVLRAVLVITNFKPVDIQPLVPATLP